IDIRVKDIHSWQLFEIADLKRRLGCVLLQRGAIKNDLVVVGVAENADVPATVGFHAGANGFRDLTRPIESVVVHSQRAFASGLLASRYSDRVKKILRAVGT